jgi:CelD/BcsL family acetyltransferase involved in cellulose biosynthesis
MVDLAVPAKIGSLEHRAARATCVAVKLFSDWRQAAAEWDWSGPGGHHAPFQHPRWLASWYSAFAATSVEPLVALISDAGSSGQIAMLPLIRHRRRGVRIVEFADLDLTDNNAPLLAALAYDPAISEKIWPALRKALRRAPGGVDVIRFRKMPRTIDGTSNPLASLRTVRRSSLNGNLVTCGDDFEAHRFARGRNERSQLRRKWRAFASEPSAAFRLVTDRDEALRALDVVARQQETRMSELRQRFVLNDGANAAFYRDLVSEGVGSGYATITVLSVGDEIVAGSLGVRSGRRWTLIRSSMGSERWLKYSPGILLIDQTMAALHAQGVREFDFSVGEYDYKRRLGACHVPLYDLTSALTLRGLPFVARDRLAYQVRQHPQFANPVRRLFGKPVSRAEKS